MLFCTIVHANQSGSYDFLKSTICIANATFLLIITFVLNILRPEVLVAWGIGLADA